MEDKKLNRVFDRVKLPPEREEAMLADLLNEKKEVSSMKQTNRRRIPAAAFAAAVLAVVLAGTALAVEYLGKVNIELLDGDAENPGKWYSASIEGGRVPADSLSEDVWAAFASADEWGGLYLPFDSRLEAETFLGLDLADNVLLERMSTVKATWYLDDQTTIQDPCFVAVTYLSEQVPAAIAVYSHYVEEGSAYYVTESIQFGTDAASEWFTPNIRVQRVAKGDFLEYVTPNGIEATIYSEPNSHTVHFIKNNMFYSIDVFDSGLDTVFEILDAYE